jgi:ribonucleoside-diphosphate reductase alpha chain
MDAQKLMTSSTIIQALLAAYGGEERLITELLKHEQGCKKPVTEEQLKRLGEHFREIAPVEDMGTLLGPRVTEVRPQALECDVVRFQNNKEKWVALVGLLDGYPYEIFTGLQDDDEGIVLPKSVTKGKIIKSTNADGTKRYDFQFENTRGYKITVEGLSEKFNPEYWNYAKLISGVLRYRMPIEHVIKLVGSLQLQSESINTWKNGVERALKKYVPGSSEADDVQDE